MDKTTQTDVSHIYKKYEEIIIYVLGCKDGKYYVGKTNDFNIRMKSHQLGKGSFWTRKYPMISILEIIRNADKFDEICSEPLFNILPNLDNLNNFLRRIIS